jgi:hypothetical protein
MRFLSAKTGRHASAILVVLILVVVMGSIIVANTQVLDRLDRELRQLDRQQKKKYGAPSPAPATPPAAPGQGAPPP